MWCGDHFNTCIWLPLLWLFRLLFPSSYTFLSQFLLFRGTSEMTGTSQCCQSHQNHFASRCSQCSYLNTSGALPLIVLCDSKVKITSKTYKSWQLPVISKSSWKCHYSSIPNHDHASAASWSVFIYVCGLHYFLLLKKKMQFVYMHKTNFK